MGWVPRRADSPDAPRTIDPAQGSTAKTRIFPLPLHTPGVRYGGKEWAPSKPTRTQPRAAPQRTHMKKKTPITILTTVTDSERVANLSRLALDLRRAANGLFEAEKTLGLARASYVEAHRRLMNGLHEFEHPTAPRRTRLAAPAALPNKKTLRARTLVSAIRAVFPKGENTAAEVRDALLEHGWTFKAKKTPTRQTVGAALWQEAKKKNGPIERTGKGLFRLKTP